MDVLGLLVLLALALPEVLCNQKVTRGQPWPMPQAFSQIDSTLVVDNTLLFTSNLATCDVIAQAFTRYKTYITDPECARAPKTSKPSQRHQDIRADPKLLAVDVNVVGDCEKWPTPTSDEQYSIIVNTPSTEGKAQITAATIWGALRALETFSQLVYNRGDGVLQINTTLILDFPRFTFRGVMLDTSRHYLPVRVLLENLEAMAQNKMNVFHWHIVDDPSFPYVSSAFPQLSKLGSFDEMHIYTPEDVADVIEFARVRGIRVIPEFDTPGHTQSWGPGEPGLLTPCYIKGRKDGTFGPVNPVVNSTYMFFKQFFAEVAGVFSDPYIHLGGDEVNFDCWKSNPDVLNFMKAKGMGQNFSLLEQYYEQNIVNIMTSLKKNFIIWQEVFDNNVVLENDTVINVWKGGYQSELANVTKAGYKTILSSPWYLNYINYGIDWHKFYTVEPYDFNGTDAQKALVIGGTACTWGEYVDAVNVMAYTWPRGSAVAERLWSSRGLTDANAAAPRLEEHRCRMMKRGLTVEVINGPSFCTCDIYN